MYTEIEETDGFPKAKCDFIAKKVKFFIFCFVQVDKHDGVLNVQGDLRSSNIAFSIEIGVGAPCAKVFDTFSELSEHRIFLLWQTSCATFFAIHRGTFFDICRGIAFFNNPHRCNPYAPSNELDGRHYNDDSSPVVACTLHALNAGAGGEEF